MDEDHLLSDLIRAHTELQRLSKASADARQRRREAARKLVETGRGPTWIAERLGVTRQAVDGFLKYEQRKR